MFPRFSILAAAALVWLAAHSGNAQNFEAALGSSKEDLTRSLEELARVQQQIADEKIPLAKTLHELEDQVLAKRREFERVTRLRDNQTVDLNSLRAETKARTDENAHLSSLLGEYVRRFETRTHISEVQRYQSLVDEAKLAGDDVNLNATERFKKQITVIQTALERIEEVMGGTTFEGRALAAQGTLEQGKYALLGPVAVFASAQSESTGIAELQLGSPEPTVIEIGKEFSGGIRSITRTGAGDLPLDPTLGNALKIASIKETWTEHLKKGGPVMIPILFLGALASLIALLKWIQVSRVRVARPRDLQAILDHLNRGDKARALEYASRIRGPAGEMLTTAIEHSDQDKELIEEVLYEKMLHTKPRLERFMPFIALTAACAPLLGLLGTVTGMINTFKMITIFGTGDPKRLSAGISEALITTEYGLMIAIPALLVHALIARRAKGVLASMEQTAVGFINGLPSRPNAAKSETRNPKTKV